MYFILNNIKQTLIKLKKNYKPTKNLKGSCSLLKLFILSFYSTRIRALQATTLPGLGGILSNHLYWQKLNFIGTYCIWVRLSTMGSPSRMDPPGLIHQRVGGHCLQSRGVNPLTLGSSGISSKKLSSFILSSSTLLFLLFLKFLSSKLNNC